MTAEPIKGYCPGTLRRTICEEVLTNPDTRMVAFDLPVRDDATRDYRRRVVDWHDAIAQVWADMISGAGAVARLALLVWGDPSLYDSTLRVAARLDPGPQMEVIPGITSLQALTAAHAIPINDLGAPYPVTTGRQLRDHGWPDGVGRFAVMLDGECAFQGLDAKGLHIWWGGYGGMNEQIICEGRLGEVGARIVGMRAEARAAHGWIMDIHILDRRG